MDAGQAAFIADLEARFRRTYVEFTAYLAAKRDEGGAANKPPNYIFSRDINSMQQTVKNTWPHIMSGGADPTYRRPEIENIEFEGNPLPAEGIPHEDNILIVGGGPNGLYMAYLLKAALQSDKWPNLHINVLEIRVNEAGRRKMTRTQEITLATDVLTEADILSQIKGISDDLYEEFSDYRGPNVTDVLDLAQPLKINSEMFKKFSRGGHERFMTHRVYRTNVLEYELANLVQSLGVNIYHDATMRRPEDIIAKYKRLYKKPTNTEFLYTNHPQFKQNLEFLLGNAKTEFPILLSGPTGSGKTFFAKQLHMKSELKGSFVQVNCSAIPKELFESEMFGHEKGAFSGAVSKYTGKIAEANGGTLYLDELDSMPLEQQAKLLKVIEEKEFSAVGSNKVQKSQFRLICSAQKDLKKMIEEGRFREDLYYRISIIETRIPT
jgi:hypothetical protein